MQIVEGTYSPNRSARQLRATVRFTQSQIELVTEDSITRFDSSQYLPEPPVPGVASNLRFSDGGQFAPDDPNVRWPSTSVFDQLVAKAEMNLAAVVVSLLLIPLCTYALIFKAIPAAAFGIATALPEDVIYAVGEQSYVALDKLFFEPSQLPQSEREQLTESWIEILNKLKLNEEKYQLLFANSERLGANALALPHGKIILTDELVALLKDKPDAITAVMLHEIGHVDKHHGLKLAIQGASTTVMISLIFGDIEILGEIILGAGGTLLQAKFSQNMESEADAFAFEHLNRLGKSPTALSEALTQISKSHNIDSESEKFLQYLSSHPSTADRVRAALEAVK